MADLKRNLERKINNLLDIFPCVVILGPRQCGKTSLAKNIRPNWKYFDLENPQTFEKLHEDLNFFFEHNSKNIIIDEAQLSADVFKTIRGVIDSERKCNGRFILTGSSSPELLSHISESLAGRVASVELSPFKVNELLANPLPIFYSIFEREISPKTVERLKGLKTTQNLQHTYKALLKGGYPEPNLERTDNKFKNWMEEYFKTYINRDVKGLFPKLDSIKYRRFVGMLTSLSGTIINRAALGRSLDVNEVSIKNYLDICHGTMIWRNIPSFEKSKIKSVLKMPKGVFRDSGLNNYLQRLNDFDKLMMSPLVGQVYESFIIEELIRGIQATNVVSWEYSYFRTKSGSEVDLVLEGEFGLLPIEIKFGTSTRLKQLTGLSKFVADHNLPFGIVINNSKNVEMISPQIIQIPANFI